MTDLKLRRRRALIGFGGAQVALLVPMLALERRMGSTGGPGIIGFELAGSPERAQQILEAWGPDGKSGARVSLLLDYPYLVSYAGLQAAGCGIAAEAFRRRGLRRLAGVGAAIGRLQWVAGAFDAVENATLLGVLAGHGDWMPGLARRCASAKFALLTLGWGYMAAALYLRPRALAP